MKKVKPLKKKRVDREKRRIYEGWEMDSAEFWLVIVSWKECVGQD